MDYPLLPSKSKIGDDSDVQVDRSLVMEYNGYIVVIVGEAFDKLRARK